MTLTPSRVRQDLKCGRGAISAGQRCTKGPVAQRKAKPTKGGKLREFAENTATIIGTAGQLVSYGQALKSLAGVEAAGRAQALGYEVPKNTNIPKFGDVAKSLQRAAAFQTLNAASNYSKGARTGKEALKRRAQANLAVAGGIALGAHTMVGGGYTNEWGAKARYNIWRYARGNPRLPKLPPGEGKPFRPDSADLAPSTLRRDAGIKCGASFIAQSKKCGNRTNGSGARTAPPGENKGYFRNYQKEIDKLYPTLEKNNFVTWLEKKDIPMPDDGPTWDKLQKRYQTSKEGKAFERTMSEIDRLERRQRNRPVEIGMGIGAVVGGALSAGLIAKELRGRRDAARRDAGIKCGSGYIAQGLKCRAGAGAAPALKGPRNYGKEIAEHSATMEANGLNGYIERNKIKRPKPGDDVAWDKLNREWRNSPDAQRYSEAWKQREAARKGRKERNGKIALGVGITAGLVGAALLTRNPRGRGPGAGTGRSAPRPGAGGPDLRIVPVRVGVGGPQRGYQARLPEGKPRGILAGTATPTPPALPGLSPRALLKGAAPRVSKTQRLRLNARAAARIAEQRIGQTAREEVRRIAQIGLTMAETGEATGMAAKNAFRGLRLRVEAARRKLEPGYRKGKTVNPPQSLLPGVSQSPVLFSQPPKIITPEGIRIAPHPASRRRIRRQP